MARPASCPAHVLVTKNWYRRGSRLHNADINVCVHSWKLWEGGRKGGRKGGSVLHDQVF